MDFPRLRFQQAGATPDELSELEQRFDAMTESAQRSQLQQLAGVSEYDIAELLEAHRAGEHDDVDEDEGDAPDPTPPAASAGQTDPAGKLAGDVDEPDAQ